LRNLPLDRGEPAVNCVPPCGTSLRSTGSQLPSAIRRTGASARNAGSPPTRATRINSSSICAASLAIGVVLLRRESEFVEQLFRQLGRGPKKKATLFSIAIASCCRSWSGVPAFKTGARHPYCWSRV